MRINIISFLGLHGVKEIVKVFREVLQYETFIVNESEETLKNPDLVVIPGGSSYADFLRPGALAKVSPIAAAIKKYANNGGVVLGIGNGFQILCELELLPGVLLINSTQRFSSGWCPVRVENNKSRFARGLDPEKIYTLPIGCYYGCYFADLRTLSDIESKGQVVLRYCDRFGDVDKDKGLNGSVNAIAGVTNEEGNVFGLMLHPERVEEGFKFLAQIS